MAKKNRIRSRARRDVMLALDPVLDELQRQGGAISRQQASDLERAEGAYNALDSHLRPLARSYEREAGGIESGLADQLTDFAAKIGLGQGSGGAANSLFGAIGGGGLEQLASQRARNAAYHTSLGQQAGVERAQAKGVFNRIASEGLADVRMRKRQARQDVPRLIGQRIDELRDQSVRHSELRRSARSDSALSQLLQSRIRGSA